MNAKKTATKKALESKTIKFNMLMGAVQSINGSLALIEPVVSPTVFAALATIIGVLHTVGGIYLRYKTKTAMEPLT
jgi:hypothetical protein